MPKPIKPSDFAAELEPVPHARPEATLIDYLAMKEDYLEWYGKFKSSGGAEQAWYRLDYEMNFGFGKFERDQRDLPYDLIHAVLKGLIAIDELPLQDLQYFPCPETSPGPGKPFHNYVRDHFKRARIEEALAWIADDQGLGFLAEVQAVARAFNVDLAREIP